VRPRLVEMLNIKQAHWRLLRKSDQGLLKVMNHYVAPGLSFMISSCVLLYDQLVRADCILAQVA
jgi:hypothetical protein